MRIAERHRIIEELLQNHDYITVENLSKALDVSKVTIRSDLSLLEEKGIVLRTHGGAMLTEIKAKRRFVSDTISELSEEKKAIGEAAAKLVEDGDMIIIDVGSTTFRVTDFLDNKRITVLTNSLLVMEALEDLSDIDMISLGGLFLKNSKGFIGNNTIASLSHINANILFLGATCYDENNIYTSNVLEAETKDAMMKASSRIVLMADSSKAGKKSYARVTDWSGIDVFITDNISQELRKTLEDNGVEIIIAESI